MSHCYLEWYQLLRPHAKRHWGGMSRASPAAQRGALRRDRRPGSTQLATCGSHPPAEQSKRPGLACAMWTKKYARNIVLHYLFQLQVWGKSTNVTNTESCKGTFKGELHTRFWWILEAIVSAKRECAWGKVMEWTFSLHLGSVKWI